MLEGRRQTRKETQARRKEARMAKSLFEDDFTEVVTEPPIERKRREQDANPMPSAYVGMATADLNADNNMGSADVNVTNHPDNDEYYEYDSYTEFVLFGGGLFFLLSSCKRIYFRAPEGV